MKVLNRGAKRAVQGHGLVDHGDILDVNDDEAMKILRIPGFRRVVEDEVEDSVEAVDDSEPPALTDTKPTPKKSTKKKSGGKKK